MKTIWTQHIDDPKKKEEFEQLLRNSNTILGRLRTILQQLEDGIDRQETSLADFEKPNWEFRQAYRNGSRATLKSLIDLLDLDKRIITQ